MLSLKCNGSIVWREFILETDFEIRCASDGEIGYYFPAFPLRDDTRWLLDLADQAGPFVEEFNIQGVADDQRLVHSDSAFLTGHSIPSAWFGSAITLSVKASATTILSPAPLDEPSLVPARAAYFSVGHRGFRQQSLSTPAGAMSIVAPSGVDDYRLITGHIVIDHPSQVANFANWLAECDEQVYAALRILSLAQGRLIGWSIRELYVGEHSVRLDLHGTRDTTAPHLASLSHLHLQPFLEEAFPRYTKAFRECTGIDLAIEWFLMNPRYGEAEFLAGMSAIEHLVDKHGRQSASTTYFAKLLFKSEIAARLVATLQDLRALLVQKGFAEGDLRPAFAAFTAGVRGLNRRTLQTKIERMLADYEVPLDGLPEGIGALIAVRNKIVHRGFFEPSRKDARSLIYYGRILRELLVRCFLTLLGYKGHYWSFLNGPEWREFPPT